MSMVVRSRFAAVRKLVALTALLMMATGLTAVVPGLTPVTSAVVPVPTSTQAVLSVKVGGNRLPNGTVAGLAGVGLSLFAAGSGNNGVGGSDDGDVTQGVPGAAHNRNWPWTTCVSDAAGDCNFVIPIRSGGISDTGVPQDTRFWVAQAPQDPIPVGWYSNPTMRLGGYAADPEYVWGYRFRTQAQLRAGQTYLSTTPLPVVSDWDTPTEPDRGFMRNRVASNAEGYYGSNVGRTTGLWSQSRTNPALAADCGLDIALVADTSGSLGATGIAQLKTAMGTFVDAFRGTPSTMSLFSFSTVSPGDGATNRATPLAVTTAAQAAIFKAQYAGWTSTGGTNWDRGLAAAANSGNRYDLVVLLTDGNPSVYSAAPPAGSSPYNAYQDVDAGIFSANQLKSAGARVVALGVGPQITAASVTNLRAVSGPTVNSDHFRANDFTAAAQVLSALAKANCQGSIEVRKMIVPAGGTTAQATPAPAGWQFGASTTATGVAVSPASAATNADGEVTFGLNFTNPATSGAVQVLETQQSGYELLPVGAGAAARNASCVDTSTATPTAVTVTNAGNTATPGFSVTGRAEAQIVCTIYNRVLPPPGVLVPSKSSVPATGTPVNPGQSVTYTLSFANTGGLPVAVDRSDVLTGVLDDATIGAITTSNPALTAARVGDRIRVTGQVPAGQTYTVSYTATVANPVTGDSLLRNFLVPGTQNPPTTCVPTTNLCTEHPIPTPRLTVSKAVAGASGGGTPAMALAGDVLTYSVKFDNTTGTGPATVAHFDNLKDVLVDATWGSVTSNGGLTATFTAGTQVLSLTGSVPGGTSRTVTYTVTVKTPVATGGGSLINVVTTTPPTGPPTACNPAVQVCTQTPIGGPVLVVSKSSNPVSGTAVAPGATVTYTLRFANTAGTSPATVAHTDRLAGVLNDATLTSGPTVTPTGALAAVLQGEQLLVTGQVPAGATVTVTYAVRVNNPVTGDGTLANFVVPTGQEPPLSCPPGSTTCTTHPVSPKLTLVKEVDFGSAATTEWILSATGPAGARPGPSGRHGAGSVVSSLVDAGQPYTLTETGGPQTYLQSQPWDCVDSRRTLARIAVDAVPAVSWDGTAVTLGPGADVVCTVTNSTATLTLLKKVEGGVAVPSAWNLTAAPAELPGLSPRTVPGAAFQAGGNPAGTFEVRPGHVYQLSEAAADPDAPLAYRLERLELLRPDGSWAAVTSGEITAPAVGLTATYRFVNVLVDPVTLPLTGGLSTDLFLIAGGAAALAGLAGAGWAWRRRAMA